MELMKKQAVVCCVGCVGCEAEVGWKAGVGRHHGFVYSNRGVSGEGIFVSFVSELPLSTLPRYLPTYLPTYPGTYPHTYDS